MTFLLERDFSAAQRRSKAKSGAAMPDGSFPIVTRQDLKNALHLVGQAKDPAAARAHIRKRAAAIGALDLLQESYDPLVEATVAALLESAAIQETDLFDLPEADLYQLIDSVIDHLDEADDGDEGSDAEEEDEDEAEEDDEETEHTGVMVALAVEEYDALRLAVPGGEAADDLHLTLAYLGEAADLSEVQQAQIVVALESIARRTPPCEGDVSGLGRFQGEPGEKDVIYASVDAPGLSYLREQLCVELCSATGVEVSQKHGFTPHITLAYIEVGAVSPIDRVPSLHLEFEQIIVAFAGRQIPFDLRGSVSQPPAMGYVREAFQEARDLDVTALAEAFDAASGGGSSGGTGARPSLSAEHKAKISASLKARSAGQSKTPAPAAPAAPAAKAPPPKTPQKQPNVPRENWDVPYRLEKEAAAQAVKDAATARATAAAKKTAAPPPGTKSLKVTAPAAPTAAAKALANQMTPGTKSTKTTAAAKAPAKPAPAPAPASKGKGDDKKDKKKGRQMREAIPPGRLDLLESAISSLERCYSPAQRKAEA